MKVLEPITIGKMTLRNRIVMTPTGTKYPNEDGTVSEEMIRFSVARARGGVALIQLGQSNPAPLGSLRGAVARIDDDRFIPGIKALADAVHAQGSMVATQLLSVGKHGSPGPVAFSVPTFQSPWTNETPRILTVEEIDQLAEFYAEAARRSRDAGCDAVDYHGAHGWLIEQSYSVQDNKRDDKYGGDFQRRMRFSQEILDRTRKKVGRDVAIIWRISGEQYQKGGYTLDDMKKMIPIFEEAGADILSVSTGFPGFYFVPVARAWPRGVLVRLAAGIKQVARVPVLAVGRIDSLWMANKIIEEGKADLIGMCRPLIVEPELVKKTVEGRYDDIQPCMFCNECMQEVSSGKPMHCMVNPTVGRLGEPPDVPAAKPKKVVVVGGGPAGMKAAAVAQSRGHSVTLIEKSDRLGGQLRVASKTPGNQEFDNLVWYLSTQVRKQGVKVQLTKAATAASVKKLNPDVVIVATGAAAAAPKIPGADSANMVIANDLLSGTAAVAGKRVVVLGGGIFIGEDVAEFLLERGKEVTLVLKQPRAGVGMLAHLRPFLVKRLEEKGLKILVNASIEEVTPRGVVVTTEGGRQTLEADTIVLAAGTEPRKELAAELEGKVPELYSIGDCTEPRKTIRAIYDGWRVGRQI